MTVYPGASHFPHVQSPRRFASDLSAFLLDPDRKAAELPFACPGAAAGPPTLPVAACARCDRRDAGEPGAPVAEPATSRAG
ncbi:MAG: hypothetical protein FJ087_13045 [Deltaproteobacteria bacterium]|nr:hypothetical protein [Deltaproteobacteria bacterium]